MRTRHALALLATATVLAAPVAAQAAPYRHTPQPVATGTGGAAATVDKTATDAAIRVLRRGGNAVDAAVAAAAVLGVVEPFSSGIGGGGVMVIRLPNGRVTSIDMRETAPAAMQPDSFFENGAALDMNSARYSGLSVGVPGTVRGWSLALRRYGSPPPPPPLAPLWLAAARPAAAAGDHGGPPRVRGRPDVRQPDHAQHPLVRRPAGDRGALRRPGRHPARDRHDARQPGSREDAAADREAGAERLLPRAGRPRHRPGRPRAADRPRCRPDLAAGPPDGGRPARLPRDRAPADPRRLPRLRRLLDG